MWKFIKGCYSVSKETVKLVGQGAEELSMGLDILNNTLENFNKDIEGTMPFRKTKNKIRLWKKVIEINRPLKSFKYMHKIFTTCELSINEFEKIIQIGLDHPNSRSIILPIVNELECIMAKMSIELKHDAEFRKELESMYENGLDKNADTASILNHYFIHTPKEKLEKMAKKEYPKVKETSEILFSCFEKMQISLS